MNLKEAAAKITKDKESGANALAIKAIEVYLNCLEYPGKIEKDSFLGKLADISQRLRNAQPSMISISNVVELVNSQIDINSQKMTKPEFRCLLLDYLIKLKSELINAKKSIADEAIKIIPPNAIIITLSESSTVEEIIKHAFLKSKLSKVIILESRPLLEGLSMAEKLLKIGVPVTIVVDAAMGYFCKQADLAIVGADTVQSDGSVVHKVGTYPLALTCADLKKPFYVACDKLKFSKNNTIQNPVKIEVKSATEVLGKKELIGADIQNIYFDITPAELITGIITEKGIFPNQA